jgi:hypothetical protein
MEFNQQSAKQKPNVTQCWSTKHGIEQHQCWPTLQSTKLIIRQWIQYMPQSTSMEQQMMETTAKSNMQRHAAMINGNNIRHSNQQMELQERKTAVAVA